MFKGSGKKKMYIYISPEKKSIFEIRNTSRISVRKRTFLTDVGNPTMEAKQATEVGFYSHEPET